jgi:hypothetical protein
VELPRAGTVCWNTAVRDSGTPNFLASRREGKGRLGSFPSGNGKKRSHIHSFDPSNSSRPLPHLTAHPINHTTPTSPHRRRRNPITASLRAHQPCTSDPLRSFSCCASKTTVLAATTTTTTTTTNTALLLPLLTYYYYFYRLVLSSTC